MGDRDERRGLHNPIRFRTSFRNTIYDAMKLRGWKEQEGDSPDGWDIHWTDRDMMFEVFDTTHLDSWQKVNHFRCVTWQGTHTHIERAQRDDWVAFHNPLKSRH